MRLSEAIETATQLSHGTIIMQADQDEIALSTSLACSNCSFGAFPELEPRLFPLIALWCL